MEVIFHTFPVLVTITYYTALQTMTAKKQKKMISIRIEGFVQTKFKLNSVQFKVSQLFVISIVSRVTVKDENSKRV